jgi:hypothetical protein
MPAGYEEYYPMETEIEDDPTPVTEPDFQALDDVLRKVVAMLASDHAILAIRVQEAPELRER